MKKIYATLRFGLLCTIIVVFFSCKKENVVTIPSTWNYSTFTDVRDGKSYKSIKIANQEWMAENLAFKTENGSWKIYDKEGIGYNYGLLYTWEAARQAVPAGWHLPTDAEWKQLEMSLGMSQADADSIDSRGTNEGGKLKTTKGWAADGSGTDEVGFSAIAGGFYMANSNKFMALDWYGYWWTATESDNSTAWFRLLVNSNSKILRNVSFKADGFSVRCVKNQ